MYLPHIKHAVGIKRPKTVICLPIQVLEGERIFDLSSAVRGHVRLVCLFKGSWWV